jgi:hypothetical protein
VTLTFTQARDEMLALFKTAWDAGASGVPLVYDDTPTDVPTAAQLANENVTAWARVTIRHSIGRQASLSGSQATRRWVREGTFFVQVFTAYGTGLQSADTFAKVAADALEGATTPGGVWFRDVSFREVGIDGPWYQTNVVATFQYDEVK